MFSMYKKAQTHIKRENVANSKENGPYELLHTFHVANGVLLCAASGEFFIFDGVYFIYRETINGSGFVKQMCAINVHKY